MVFGVVSDFVALCSHREVFRLVLRIHSARHEERHLDVFVLLEIFPEVVQLRNFAIVEGERNGTGVTVLRDCGDGAGKCHTHQRHDCYGSENDFHFILQ